MCVFRACNLCADQANKHVQGFFIWVSYHDEHARALAARASTQICHGACGSCPCRSRPLRLCVPADPVPAPITWRLLLIITFKRILPMQLLHMRLRHPQQLLVHAPIASNYARHSKRRMGDVRGSRAGDIRACDCVADRRCLLDSELLSSIHT